MCGSDWCPYLIHCTVRDNVSRAPATEVSRCSVQVPAPELGHDAPSFRVLRQLFYWSFLLRRGSFSGETARNRGKEKENGENKKFGGAGATIGRAAPFLFPFQCSHALSISYPESTGSLVSGASPGETKEPVAGTRLAHFRFPSPQLPRALFPSPHSPPYRKDKRDL